MVRLICLRLFRSCVDVFQTFNKNLWHPIYNVPDSAGKLLRIVRKFSDESGNLYRTVEIVRDPDVISGYIRVKKSKAIDNFLFRFVLKLQLSRGFFGKTSKRGLIVDEAEMR